jgi:AAA+ ATPase superfamily predicted ATPase
VHDHILKGRSHSWGLLQRGELIRLDALDRKSATRLIQQPLEEHYRIEPEVINRILYLSNCHPYFLQIICRYLMLAMAPVDHHYISLHELEHTVKHTILPYCTSFFSHYQSSVGKTEWEVLEVIAYKTETEKTDKIWISGDEIREQVERYHPTIDRKLVSKSLGELRNAGLIVAQDIQGQAAYRIPVGLFHQWLREVVTSHIVRQNEQREE